MTKIWMNHWFSTAYNIVKLIKQNEPNFWVIGSNEKENAVMQLACDQWHVEPVLESDAYVDFCLGFCQDHKIDIFIPRRHMVAISRRREEFENMGVKVMVDDYETMVLLNQKDKAYALLREHKIDCVPQYTVVTTAAEFKAAYDLHAQNDSRVCFKFVNDEGGSSFRLIDNTRVGFNALLSHSSTRITLDTALEALSEREAFEPLMVMPFLPDQEVSVDCLMTDTGLIMLPRIKDHTRIERFAFDETISGLCQEIYGLFNFKFPCNIQFKYLNGKPYFLEVNTRMSGGIPMACLAGAVNIPNIAVNQLLGVSKKWEVDKKPKNISHVEMPVVFAN